MPQQFVSRLVSVMTATTVVAWMSVVAVPSAQRSETEGVKETATFVKTGADTERRRQAKMQLQRTLDVLQYTGDSTVERHEGRPQEALELRRRTRTGKWMRRGHKSRPWRRQRHGFHGACRDDQGHPEHGVTRSGAAEARRESEGICQHARCRCGRPACPFRRYEPISTVRSLISVAI